MAKYLVSIDSTEDPGERLPTAVREEIASLPVVAEKVDQAEAAGIIFALNLAGVI